MKKVYITPSLEKMIIFINRILYSYYCFERWSFRLMDRIFRPLIIPICRLMYTWNPFGIIRKRNKNLDDYIKNVFFASNEVSYNLDYGTCILRGETSLFFSFLPYLMFIAALAKYLMHDFFSKESFNTFVIVASCISLLINYLAVLRNDKFKLYFKKFDKEKKPFKVASHHGHILCRSSK